MLDQLGALTVLHAAKTAHHPAHSPHIVKSVQQALDTYAIVESLKTQPLASGDHSLTGVFEELASDGARGLAHFLTTFQPDQNYIPLLQTLEAIHNLMKDACQRRSDLQTAKYYQDLLREHLARLGLQSGMDIVENISPNEISRGAQSLADGVFGWEQDAGHPEPFGRAGNRQRSDGQDSVTPTTSFGREHTSTSTRFSDSNPFRKQIQTLSSDFHTPRSHEWEPQQGIGNHAPSRVPHHGPPNIRNMPLIQQSSTFLPPSGYTHPVFQPSLPRSPLTQSQLLGGSSHAESLSGAASLNTGFRARERMEGRRDPMPWSTPPYLGLQPSTMAHTLGDNPINSRPWGLGGLNNLWSHGESPAWFQHPQPAFSPGRGPIIIGNQNTINFTCHTHDSGNATTTTLTGSANNSSSRISGNTGTFPPF